MATDEGYTGGGKRVRENGNYGYLAQALTRSAYKLQKHFSFIGEISLLTKYLLNTTAKGYFLIMSRVASHNTQCLPLPCYN